MNEAGGTGGIGARFWRGAFFFVALALGCLRCDSGLREDELECERTAIHLKECCPRMRESAVDCEYVAPSDCGDGSLPDLTVEDAQCLRGLSCADLVAAGVCLAVTTPTSSPSGSSGSSGASGSGGSGGSSSGGRISSRTVCR
jgi:uncharacterized membrane protein YgcG